MVHNHQQLAGSRRLRRVVGMLGRMLLWGVLAVVLIGVVAYVALHVKPGPAVDASLQATATAKAHQYPPGTREYYYWNQGQQQPAPEQPQQ